MEPLAGLLRASWGLRWASFRSHLGSGSGWGAGSARGVPGGRRFGSRPSAASGAPSARDGPRRAWRRDSAAWGGPRIIVVGGRGRCLDSMKGCRRRTARRRLLPARRRRRRRRRRRPGPTWAAARSSCWERRRRWWPSSRAPPWRRAWPGFGGRAGGCHRPSSAAAVRSTRRGLSCATLARGRRSSRRRGLGCRMVQRPSSRPRSWS